jgi:hypothetical protein
MGAWTLLGVAAQADDFDQTVAPLLARRCLECHSGADPKGELDLSQQRTSLRGGESGAVISPGKPAESLVWEYVRDDEMPPKKPLTAAEKEIVRAWIAAGAKWGADPIDPYRYSSDRNAGYDWWSLRPVVQPPRPAVRDRDWARGEIDYFILQRLEEAGLAPSPEADRRTLIRRLSFDLLGLPPSPSELDAFVNDPDPAAYEKLVDRLLASPHYGERWGRHWLDVARFGESDGFEYDRPRPNAWPYRDWVIAALNDDMPYDEFARRQIAGDVLEGGGSVTATGFLVGGAFDGLKPAGDKMRAIMRQDELDDLVAVVSQSFLGLTVNCARCHDHKFDPIRQTDYYRIASALAGVHRGDRQTPAGGDVESLTAELRALQQQISAITDPVRATIVADKQQDQPKLRTPDPIASWEFNGDLRDEVGELHGAAHGGAKIADGRLVLDGRTSYVATAPLAKDLSEKTLSVWLLLDNTKQRGGGAISLQTLDGGVFDAIVFGERDAGQWMAGSNNFSRTESFRATAEPGDAIVHLAITYAADGTISAFRNGQAYGAPYRSAKPVLFRSGGAQVLFGLRHGTAGGGNRVLAASIERAALFDRALKQDEIAALSGIPTATAQEINERLTPEQQARLAALREQAGQREAALARVRTQTVYAATPKPAPVVHLLKRGSPFDPGEPIAAAGLSAVEGLADEFGLAPSAPEAARRRKLAEWIADPANPLFARTIVNRVWHYHFGAGLVPTPNDLGFSGGPPSHPQLLDYLAVRLVENEWSLKQLHREILRSATYRQSGQVREAAARVDAQNRLLWRKAPLRLEAELVRDAVLSVAGQLNPAMGGPGFEDFEKRNEKNTWRYDPVDRVGAQYNRRSIYRTWARGGRNPLLDTFDCPDPSTTAPSRGVTNTPLQALVLLNNSFVLRMSDAFAERLIAEAGAEPTAQVRRAYEIALGRPASEEEAQRASAFVRQHNLPAFCRVLFNANEFLYAN